MKEITVLMALVDFIPVILFFLATLFLQKDLYSQMSKYAYAMLASGSYFVLISGCYKALWKILYALKICDFTVLNTSFFAIQAPGFLLVFLSLLLYVNSHNKSKNIAAPSIGFVPVYSSNLVFIVGQVLGSAGMQFCLMIIARRKKESSAFFFFLLSFVSMLGMGYLSAKFDQTSSMHWIAQITNIISQGALFLGVIVLHRRGGLSSKRMG